MGDFCSCGISLFQASIGLAVDIPSFCDIFWLALGTLSRLRDLSLWKLLMFFFRLLPAAQLLFGIRIDILRVRGVCAPFPSYPAWIGPINILPHRNHLYAHRIPAIHAAGGRYRSRRSWARVAVFTFPPPFASVSRVLFAICVITPVPFTCVLPNQCKFPFPEGSSSTRPSIGRSLRLEYESLFRPFLSDSSFCV